MIHFQLIAFFFQSSGSCSVLRIDYRVARDRADPAACRSSRSARRWHGSWPCSLIRPACSYSRLRRGPGRLTCDAVGIEPRKQVRLAEREPSVVIVFAAARQRGRAHVASNISVAPRATSLIASTRELHLL